MEIKNSGGIEPTDNRDEFDDEDYMEDFGRTARSGKDIAKRIQGEKDDSHITPILRDLYKIKPRWLPRSWHLRELERISAMFPNFVEPLGRFELQMQLCSIRSAKRFTAPNMLLVGPPGIGKTYMMKELCKALGVSYQCISMSLASEGFYLTGLQRGYGTSTPGQLAKVMAKSRHINPFILLDEIEKSAWKGADGRKGVENPLLQMLERDSAGEVEDLCLETTLDLSEVTYICTANSTEGIPEPILSRMTVFNIPEPSSSMLQMIVESVLNEAATEDLGLSGITIYATPDVASVFNDVVSPRTIRNAAAAIMAPQLLEFPERDEFHICAEDIIPHMPKVAEKAREIGFHASV